MSDFYRTVNKTAFEIAQERALEIVNEERQRKINKSLPYVDKFYNIIKDKILQKANCGYFELHYTGPVVALFSGWNITTAHLVALKLKEEGFEAYIQDTFEILRTFDLHVRWYDK